METTIEKALTTAETKQFAACESVIECGMQTFAEVGVALAAIRNGRLYRTAGQPDRTFADYCRERWDMSKTHANRLADASAIVEHLTPIGVIPATESQCRPLTTLRAETEDGEKNIDLQQVGDVWAEIIKRAPREEDDTPIVTAAHVKETVKWWKAESDSTPGEATAQKPDEPDPALKGSRLRMGVIHANEAINCLVKICKNDQLRKRGFQIVSDWIRTNR